MNILNHIVANKRKDIALKKSLIPSSQLEQSILFDKTTQSLGQRLKNSHSGIIAEHKRRSPSKSIINQSLNVEDVAKGYEDAGACGMSVLTNGKYFGGSLEDLLLAKASCNLPLLRKEFIIDPYQIIEAKAFGADVILLIASILSQNEIKQFSELAKTLGLEVLLEVHNQEDLNKSLIPSIDIIGINNRNLKTFEVSTNTSKMLSQEIPNEFIKISESGIDSVSTIKELRTYGFKGFLIGETFMKTNTPGATAKNFIKQLES